MVSLVKKKSNSSQNKFTKISNLDYVTNYIFHHAICNQ